MPKGEGKGPAFDHFDDPEWRARFEVALEKRRKITVPLKRTPSASPQRILPSRLVPAPFAREIPTIHEAPSGFFF